MGAIGNKHSLSFAQSLSDSASSDDSSAFSSTEVEDDSETWAISASDSDGSDSSDSTFASTQLSDSSEVDDDDDLTDGSSESADDSSTESSESFTAVNATNSDDSSNDGARGRRNKKGYVAGDGEGDEPFDLVVNISKASWLSIWAMFVMFCLVNSILICCYY